MGTKKYDFDIIDAHTHIFRHISGFGARGELRSIGNGKACWATGEEVNVLTDGSESFTYDKLIALMDGHGVSKAVILQGPFLGFGNEYIHEAQTGYPDRLFGMGIFDPYCIEYLKIMNHLIKDLKFKGLKFEISQSCGLMGYHSDFRLDSSRMRPVWDFAQNEELTISIDMGTFGEPSIQVDELAGLSGHYPAVTFVVEHIFFPHLNNFDKVRSAIKKLAPYENVYFTVASIPDSTQPEKYPYPSARKYIEIAKEMVGAKRILWGSDVPMVLNNAAYSQLIDYIGESCIFSKDELEAVFSGNARNVYKI